MTIIELRSAVVAEARSWIGTPYHEGGRKKGVGCDCVTLIAEVLLACGIVSNADIEFFGRHWWVNAKEETYMLRLLRHAAKTIEAVSYPTLNAQPGDIVMVRALDSRVYNHGGIVTRWPLIVHAIGPQVEETDASTHNMWAFKTVAVLDPYLRRAA